MRRPLSTKGAQSAQKSLSLTRAVEEVVEQGNGQDLIQVFLETGQLTLKLDSDHTCSRPHAAAAADDSGAATADGRAAGRGGRC